MISFRINSHRFHFRAAAIALERGHLLLHKLEGDTFWALPGGRVEAGEEASQTIVREFQEELNILVTCNDLLGVGENFFEYGGEPHHDLGLYFSVSLPEDSEIGKTGKIHIGIEGHRRLVFKWFPLPELRDIDFRPAALRNSLASGKIPKHFVQRG
jgi:8-oxo-dGTP pyrophosphatase MutT (NUDIX family)